MKSFILFSLHLVLFKASGQDPTSLLLKKMEFHGDQNSEHVFKYQDALLDSVFYDQIKIKVDFSEDKISQIRFYSNSQELELDDPGMTYTLEYLNGKIKSRIESTHSYMRDNATVHEYTYHNNSIVTSRYIQIEEDREPLPDKVLFFEGDNLVKTIENNNVSIYEYDSNINPFYHIKGAHMVLDYSKNNITEMTTYMIKSDGSKSPLTKVVYTYKYNDAGYPKEAQVTVWDYSRYTYSQKFFIKYEYYK